MSTMQGPQGDAEKVIAIEYHRHGKKWIPHSVLTTDATYDWEVTPDGDQYYHDSGSGGGGDYEAAHYCGAPELWAKLWVDRSEIPNITINKKIATPEAVRALGTQIIDKPVNGNPFDDARESEGSFEYCIQCDGYWPADGVCRHLKWQEGGGYYLGCGASECNYAETQESLYRLLRMLPDDTADKWIKYFSSKGWWLCFHDSMLGGNCSIEFNGGNNSAPDIYCEPLGEQLEYEDRFWPGVAWILSLEPKCKEAVALTIGWLWQWQRQSWRARCVLENTTFYHAVESKVLDSLMEGYDGPHCPRFEEKPWIVSTQFKPQCANDFSFLRNPEGTREVRLRSKTPKKDQRTIVLSVAQVKRINGRKVAIYFGAVIEVCDQHVSNLEGYRLTTQTSRIEWQTLWQRKTVKH